MEYEVNNTIDQTRQLNLTGNIIPHSWYSRITFENGKTDLIAIALLAEIIYWYRPSEIKCERTGRLLGYKKKFRADMLQRSNGSFADQFGLTKRQIADALKRLEDGGLIIRQLRTVDTSQGKIGNVQYLAPVVSRVSDLDNDPEDTRLLGDESENEDDIFIPLSEFSGDATPPITFKRDRDNVETLEGLRSNVIGTPFKRDTYTEITTQITTENTAASKVSKSAAAFSKKMGIDGSDALIGDVLTPNQLAIVQNTARELSVHIKCDPETFVKELETVLISNKSFTYANCDFLKKLNTIKKMIKERGWQTPVAFVEKQKSDDKKKIDPVKRELNEAELDCAHWEKMVRIYVEKGQKKESENFAQFLQQAQKKVEQLKEKFSNYRNDGMNQIITLSECHGSQL